MQHRRTGAFFGAVVLFTLAACGSGSDTAVEPADDDAAVATAPADDVISEDESPEVADELAEPEADAVEEAPAENEPVSTEPPEAPAPAEPVVGGRLLAADVQPDAEFDANPFPDLLVDDIGKDTQINVRNILPSDRPVLLWAWAPH